MAGKGRRGRPRKFIGICPRCGRPVSWIEKYEKGGRTYYVACHYNGYDPRTGKKDVDKCYLGPDYYEYVSRTHTMTFEGARREVDNPYSRAIDYLDMLISLLGHIDLEPEEALRLAERFRKVADSLEASARKRREEP